MLKVNNSCPKAAAQEAIPARPLTQSIAETSIDILASINGRLLLAWWWNKKKCTDWIRDICSYTALGYAVDGERTSPPKPPLSGESAVCTAIFMLTTSAKHGPRCSARCDRLSAPSSPRAMSRDWETIAGHVTISWLPGRPARRGGRGSSRGDRREQIWERGVRRGPRGGFRWCV